MQNIFPVVTLIRVAVGNAVQKGIVKNVQPTIRLHIGS